MKNNCPHIIGEIANTHGGNLLYLVKLIKLFSKINYSNLSIKFQIFSPSGLAAKDYHAYNLYKKLSFSKKEWSKIFLIAKKYYKFIWIDIFDNFGFEVFKENEKNIGGIKLQASALANDFLIDRLKNFKRINSKKIILNISGYKIKKIQNIIQKLSDLKKNLIIQFGFQGYPTLPEDSGVNKIKLLKRHFNYPLSYADHNDKDSSDAFTAPIISYQLGCNYLEKHICLDYKKTKYDLFSSFNFKNLKKFIDSLLAFKHQKTTSKFISFNETKYLSNSILKPVAKNKLKKGQSFISNDVVFKRSDQKSDNYYSSDNFYIATKNIKEDEVLNKKNIKKIKVGLIIGARMKSSRLKKKAILKINKKKSILCCMESASKVSKLDKLILATSNLKEDSVLSKIKFQNFEIFKGSPENLVKRYYFASKKYKLDVIIRITGDCPYVSREVIDILLNSHIKQNAEYTACVKSTIGTAAEIYNFDTIKKIFYNAKSFEHSEYMTWYILNNKKFFKINLVNLPTKLVRNYRLTLDYKEDLIFFNKLYGQLENKKLDINLKNIYKLLDNNKKLNKINSKHSLIWKVNKNLINQLNISTKF